MEAWSYISESNYPTGPENQEGVNFLLLNYINCIVRDPHQVNLVQLIEDERLTRIVNLILSGKARTPYKFYLCEVSSRGLL